MLYAGLVLLSQEKSQLKLYNFDQFASKVKALQFLADHQGLF